MTRNLLTAAQVARRLGVQLETVYAYVSRGILDRTLAEDGRTSRFDSAQVEELSRRGRPRRESQRQGGVDVSLATSITGIHQDRLLFRGHDAIQLATTRSFEAVAELLWTGAFISNVTWPPLSRESQHVLAASRELSKLASPLERLQVLTSLLGSVHPLRVDLRPEKVTEHARILLTGFAQLGPLARTPGRAPKAASIAYVLARRLSPLAPTPERVALVNAALVLLADHELASSTLAARVAASTRADPFSVVLAGLGTLSGPLHGKAAVAAHRMLADAGALSPAGSVARTLQELGRVPGFGRHPVYTGADPRARALLDLLRADCPPRVVTLVDAVCEAASEAAGAPANVDFGLAAVAFALRMPIGSTEAIFALARSAGFVAHALEEYGEEPLRFRARSLYIGPSSAPSLDRRA